MPLDSQTKPYLTFLGGLNTESSPLLFPENTAKDLDNIDLTRQGGIKRRLGIDFETNGVYSATPFTDIKASTKALGCHVWTSVNGNGSQNFLVVQIGDTLYFHDAGQETFSTAILGKIVFSNLKIVEDFDTYPVRMASGKGKLFVVGRKISPFYVQYNEEAGTFTGYKLTLKIRDMQGIKEDSEFPLDPVGAVDTPIPQNPDGTPSVSFNPDTYNPFIDSEGYSSQAYISGGYPYDWQLGFTSEGSGPGYGGG